MNVHSLVEERCAGKEGVQAVLGGGVDGSGFALHEACLDLCRQCHSPGV